jgi:hypothetical protein
MTHYIDHDPAPASAVDEALVHTFRIQRNDKKTNIDDRTHHATCGPRTLFFFFNKSVSETSDPTWL